MDTILEKDIGKPYIRPMRSHWREMFSSKVDAAVPWDRWDFVAVALAMLTVLWVFVLKLKTFYGLGYSGDLFESVQAARSWLEGRGLLQDNCVGNILAIHTYFLFLPLGLIAKPFGAPGLLFVLAAFVGAAYFWSTRILRLLGVDGGVAIIAAGALLISPLSVAFYQEAGQGFQLESRHSGTMFNAALFSPSTANRPVNHSRTRCHQCEGGRANCRSHGGDRSRRRNMVFVTRQTRGSSLELACGGYSSLVDLRDSTSAVNFLVAVTDDVRSSLR